MTAEVQEERVAFLAEEVGLGVADHPRWSTRFRPITIESRPKNGQPLSGSGACD